MKLILFLLLATLLGHHDVNVDVKIKGITMVAPPDPINAQSIERLAKTNADWVAFVPYGFIREGQSEIIFNLERQWWGERMDGLAKCIEMAKKQHMKIMLKPQIWTHEGWIGDLDYDEDRWNEWEESYTRFIMAYTDLAVKYEVEMFCLGTEINRSVQKRPHYWIKLVDEVKKKYKGKITYSANWDNYDKVTFWNKLDYIGISSYFPLTEVKTPSVALLKRKWKNIANKLKLFSKQNNRKILFTEYGYLTVDGCADKCWELESKVNQLNQNQKAQANSFEALYSTYWSEDYWAGGFIWKWFPEGMGHEGYKSKDYCPQDKEAENIIAKWYGK